MFVRGPKPGSSAYQENWQECRLRAVPRRFANRIKGIFERKRATAGDWIANAWIREETQRFADYRLELTASDDDIICTARRAAHECFAVGACAGFSFDKQRLHDGMAEYCRRWKVAPAAPKIDEQGEIHYDGAIARMSDENWWRRKLRQVHARGLEAEAVRLGFVHRRGDIYCSDETLKRRQQQKRRNAATLDNLVAVNDLDQQYTLGQLAALSVANPEIRRGELMTRIAGFEACAKAAGHAGEFVTLTCPSQYHSHLSESGDWNPAYKGHSPRAAARYLAQVWARVRAKLAREGIEIYGFRIAEPHHDGCPHWHLLLFMRLADVDGFRDCLRHYALALDGNEAGAEQNRVKFVAIDWARGSAAGYVAKYVAKNIDGYRVGEDLTGMPSIEASARVEAWASTWGIRQFQQIGGPSVTIWRELRRVKNAETETAEAARSAADVGNWARYVEVMGGPAVSRQFRPLALAYSRPGERINRGEPQPAPLNRYGEVAAPVVYGVRDVLKGVATATRLLVWRIVGRVRQVVSEGVQAFAPWTRVNNCTEGDANGRGYICGGGAESVLTRDCVSAGVVGGGAVAYQSAGGELCRSDFTGAALDGSPNFAT